MIGMQSQFQAKSEALCELIQILVLLSFHGQLYICVIVCIYQKFLLLIGVGSLIS
jgi:hypothetical protein